MLISCNGQQLYERGVDLEVEGMRYIEMHRGSSTYILGPPPSRGEEEERRRRMPNRDFLLRAVSTSTCGI